MAVARDFSLLHSIQMSSTAHQPPVQWVLGTLSPKVKYQVCKAHLSPPSSAKAKNSDAIPLLKCLHGIVLNYIYTGINLALPYTIK
jgi:hypothetical protein